MRVHQKEKDAGPIPIYDVTTIISIVKHLFYFYLFGCLTTCGCSSACPSIERMTIHRYKKERSHFICVRKNTKSEKKFARARRTTKRVKIKNALEKFFTASK
jgi:hypothetical protein